MMRSRFIFTALIIVGILLPVATIGHLRFYSSRSRLPESGKERCVLDGLSESVVVSLDSGGVPHISASNSADLFFAQGFVEARDRFFQMDLLRRRARGRLAEVLGEDYLDEDRAARIFRFDALARRQAASVDEEEREVLKAFTAGVNAALESYGSWISPETWSTGLAPKPWSIEDSLAIGVRWSFDLSPALSAEVRRWRELSHYGPETAVQLWSWTSAQRKRWLPPMDHKFAPGAFLRLVERIYPSAGWASGANLWALAPGRCSGEKAILANSLHHEINAPRQWYAIDLREGDFHVAGLAIPGIPGVVVGHNDRVAWGLAPSMIDDMDLFEVRLDETGNHERIDREWVSMRTVRENIPVRWKDHPDDFKIRISRYGPVLFAQQDRGIALKWSGTEIAHPLRPFLLLMKSRSADGAVESLAGMPAPSLVVMVADVEHHIAQRWLGLEVIRGRGAGRLPAPGDSSRWDWKGFRSPASNPGYSDPENGFLVFAGDDLLTEGVLKTGAHFPYGEYSSAWRGRRIRDRLRRRNDWTGRACLDLQMDLTSTRLIALMKLLRPEIEELGGAQLHRLLKWDGILSPDSPEAFLYEMLLVELGDAIGGDEASLAGMPDTAFDPERIMALLAGGISSGFWDDQLTENIEDREEILRRVFRQLDGLDLVPRWGDVHRKRLHHPLDRFPLFGSLFSFINRREHLSYGGDDSTVFSTPTESIHPFRLKGAPNACLVMRPGDWDEVIVLLPLGESGRLWSAHSSDQLGDWRAGRPRLLPFTEQAVKDATRAHLLLVPGQGSSIDSGAGMGTGGEIR